MEYTLAIIMATVIAGLMLAGEVKKLHSRRQWMRREARLVKEMCQQDAEEFLEQFWNPPAFWHESQLAYYEHRTNGGTVQIQPDGARIVTGTVFWTGRRDNGRIS